MHVEGIWSDNEHTARGTILHRTADDGGYETDKGVKLLRALPLYSQKFGLSGKADIVERRGAEIIPVEYKKGRRRQFENDDIQLCAQGLCLAEMFQAEVRRGFIFHAASRRRREVVFDEILINETVKTIEAVRALLQAEKIPAAQLKPRCDGCSLYGICLPRLSDPHERKMLEADLELNFEI